MYSTSLACSRHVCFLIVFCLKKKKLHEVISWGQENMRMAPDTGKNEIYKKTALLMA